MFSSDFINYSRFKTISSAFRDMKVWAIYNVKLVENRQIISCVSELNLTKNVNVFAEIVAIMFCSDRSIPNPY